MPTYTQEKRPLAVETPLGKDALLLTSFSGHEAISRLFHFQLECLSEKKSIDPKQIVGKPITFWIEFPDGQPRHFHGIVQRFAYCGTGDRLSTYRAEVVPWLWLLTRTSDCRIFQNKSVPDILQQVFKDLGFTDFKLNIQGSLPPREYCVQYRESDFQFVSRLMEEEGIFYYFKHEQGKHQLMLGNHPGAYYDCRDSEVNFGAPEAEPEFSDQILSWQHQYEFKSGKWAHTDYNFEDPSTRLLVEQSGRPVLPGADKFELFDYPGEYAKKPDGQRLGTLRMQEEEADFDVVSGESIARSFSPGGKFKIAKHYNSAEAGKKYVITSVRHEASVGETYVTGAGAAHQTYHNSFTCIPDSVPYRPQRTTPKAVVHGAHTAVVVGPPGEEIHTDKYGRIKVQFHWDREGKKDDKSSCWIRCAQTSAGKGWGAMALPRIGQEVVVSYLEGDPDQPLVTGVVYNADQMPPYALPGEKTKSYIKTNSSPGGEGFNEIRFEDKTGEEQFYVHAQKDMDVLVENDQRTTIGNERHLTVGADDLEQYAANRHITIDGNRDEQIAGDSRLSVTGNEHRTIDSGRCEKVGQDLNLTVGGNQNEEVGQNYSRSTGMNVNDKIGQNLAVEAGMAIHIKAGMTLVLEAGMQLSLKVGGSFIDLSPAGVAINGVPMTMINSGGAAGSGGGCKPTTPTAPAKAEPSEPKEADKTAKSGQKSAS